VSNKLAIFGFELQFIIGRQSSGSILPIGSGPAELVSVIPWNGMEVSVDFSLQEKMTARQGIINTIKKFFFTLNPSKGFNLTLFVA
jgi:hypothetical protein